MKRKKRDITEYIVVHWAYCPPDEGIDVETIERWHRERGYIGIGYHFVIPFNGDIQEGVRQDRQGTHLYGYNDSTIGVCLVGGMDPLDGTKMLNFSDAQLVNLMGLLDRLTSDYPQAEVRGHRDLAPERSPWCPGFDAHTFFNKGEVRPVEGVNDNLSFSGVS